MTHRNSHWLTLAVCLSSILLCSACANLGLPQMAGTNQHADDSVVRVYQDTIQLSGKISVRYEKDNKPQQLPGNFEWNQDGQHLQILLLSPLGQTLARITQDDHRAILEQEGQAPRYAQNLDELLQNRLGWALPVIGLRDWLQGFIRKADGKRVALSRVDQKLDSDGWNIRYASWQTETTLPKRIELNRYTTEAGNISISIFIQAPSP
ncbi:lipoprotein insertase outer membrane protein LolB [Undibacterium sp. SXout20W]|uniref:lipoprotein insertase outer membrane protein LolB n=1 Tax=Undibacterium sp. SXout20W TaxID=3413051 RepID=UPI003BEFF6B8